MFSFWYALIAFNIVHPLLIQQPSYVHVKDEDDGTVMSEVVLFLSQCPYTCTGTQCYSISMAIGQTLH